MERFDGLTKFGNFRSLESLMVTPKTNIFIADFNLPNNVCGFIDELSKTSGRNIVVYDGNQLTANLVGLINQDGDFAQNQTAFLFPGKGAAQVKDYLDQEKPELMRSLEEQGRIFQFPCERIFKSGEICGVSVNLPRNFQPKDYEKIYVIDDVIASGETLYEIARSSYDLLPFGEKVWISIEAFSWLALDTKRRRKKTGIPPSIAPSSVYLIEKIQSVISYDSTGDGIPPCNSLSTIAKGDQKSAAVIAGLKIKYFNYPLFDSFINFLQREYGKRNN